MQPLTRRSLLRAALLPVALTLGILPKARASAPAEGKKSGGGSFNLTLQDDRPQLIAKFDVSQFSGPGSKLQFADGFVDMLEDGRFAAYTADGQQLRVKQCDDKVCVLPVRK